MLQATDGGQRTLRTQVPAKPTDEGSQDVIKSPTCSSPVSRVHDQVVSHVLYHVLVNRVLPLPPPDKNNLICGKLHPQSWYEPFVSAEVTSPLSAQTQTNASCLSVLYTSNIMIFIVFFLISRNAVKYTTTSSTPQPM